MIAFTETRTRQRRRWIALFTGAILVTGFCLVVGERHWLRALGREASRGTNDKRVKTLQLPGTRLRSSQDLERGRALTPSSTTLVLHVRRSGSNSVFKIDTSTMTLTDSPYSVWEGASGDIIDSIQVSRELGPPPYNTALAQLFKIDDPFEAGGRHVLHTVWSPKEDKIAIVTADGKFHAQEPGMFFGGSPPHADGQYHLEVRQIRGGNVLMRPVAIPSFSKQSPTIWWTADERFLVCEYDDNRIAFVPTGLQAPAVLSSGLGAKSSNLAVFQPDSWWDELPGWRRELQIRYENTDGPFLLLRATHGGEVYRYDPYERTLSRVRKDAWYRARGPEYNSDALWPKVDPNLEKARHKSGQQCTPEELELLRKEATRQDHLSTLLKKVAPIGKIIRHYKLTSDESRMAVRSLDSEDDPYFFHELFDVVTGKRIGEPVRIPKAVEAGPTWTPDNRYVFYLRAYPKNSPEHWKQIQARQR